MILERDPGNGRITRTTGRKPGVVEKVPRKQKMLAQKAVQDQYHALHELSYLAMQQLTRAVKRRDVEAAKFVLAATHSKPDHAPMHAVLPDADCSTFEGVLEAGAAIVEGMTRGDVSIGQAKHSLAVLKEYAGLRMLDEIEKLKELLASIETATAEKMGDTTRQTLPADQLPTWGGLGGQSPRDKQAQLDEDAAAEAELRRSILE